MKYGYSGEDSEYESDKDFIGPKRDSLSEAMKRRKKDIAAKDPSSSIKYGQSGIDDTLDVNGNVVG